jgi:hypothetical protein
MMIETNKGDNMKNAQYTEAQLEAYKQHIINDYKSWCRGCNFGTDGFSVEFMPGSKYMRVVTMNRSSRSSHSFIDAAGKIWKSASWKAPAKNFTRGDITTGDFSRVYWTGAN